MSRDRIEGALPLREDPSEGGLLLERRPTKLALFLWVGIEGLRVAVEGLNGQHQVVRVLLVALGEVVEGVQGGGVVHGGAIEGGNNLSPSNCAQDFADEVPELLLEGLMLEGLRREPAGNIVGAL